MKGKTISTSKKIHKRTTEKLEKKGSRWAKSAGPNPLRAQAFSSLRIAREK